MRIKNGKLLTMAGLKYEQGYIDLENGKIVRLGDQADAPAWDGETLDAQGGYILPGLVDAHTHIGICEESVRWEGSDCNESTSPVTPQMRALDGFYPFDPAIEKAVSGGVTSCAVSPGSANVIGGQICFVKLHGADVKSMVVKAPSAMKFAMGENPKHCYGQAHGTTPMTRMATAALIRDALDETRHYILKKEKEPNAYDARWEALTPVLKGEIPAQFHAHRSDDILTAMRLADEFSLRYTIIHATDSVAIWPQLKAAGIIPIVGPSLGPSGKPETRAGGFQVAGQLFSHGIEVAITTDHDVLPLKQLSVFAALCVREGLDEDAALRAITINPARAAGADDRVGSLAPGKDADVAVFSGHPFDFRTLTRAVFIGGERVF